MRSLRQWHLYLGCFFSPLLAYFAISGGWQVYRFNDVPKDAPSAVRSFFHELSKPHTHSTLPGQDSKVASSRWFDLFAVATAVGIFLTLLLGVVLAFQMEKRRKPALILLLAGTLVPIVFLFLHR